MIAIYLKRDLGREPVVQKLFSKIKVRAIYKKGCPKTA